MSRFAPQKTVSSFPPPISSANLPPNRTLQVTPIVRQQPIIRQQQAVVSQPQQQPAQRGCSACQRKKQILTVPNKPAPRGCSSCHKK